MAKAGKKIKIVVILAWLVFFLGSLYIYFFHRSFFETELNGLAGTSVYLAYFIFLLAGCLRGFSLIPVTYFIVVGVLLLPPLPLYILTIIGVMVSSACVYYFSEYMNFDSYFESKYKKQVDKVKALLTKNELPIVITWSFMPFLPTDLMCYVCGTLNIDVKKFLLGVFIGEGVACAIYIFLGKEILNYIKF
jgi:uncharacterized membrane protein YdjX (TVP38/TMEM64 family)